MSTPVEQLAILLQDAKALMEKTGLSVEHESGFLIGAGEGIPTLDEIYRTIASTIYDLEERAGVDAPALRDARDEARDTLAEFVAEAEAAELLGTPLCQCNDPGCPPHCGDRCNLLPVCHLVRIDTDVLPSRQAKVQMCEFCGESALKHGVFAVDRTVGSEE